MKNFAIKRITALRLCSGRIAEIAVSSKMTLRFFKQSICGRTTARALGSTTIVAGPRAALRKEGPYADVETNARWGHIVT